MSKFVDKLHKLSKTSVSSIGFHAAASEAKSPPMLLVAGLSGVVARDVEAIAGGNVDAGLILSQSFKRGGLKRMIKAMGDIPLGVVVNETDKEKIGELIGSGCDFIVFDMRTPVAVLEREGIGKLLAIEPSIDQSLVRAAGTLDIDGVFINRGEESFITVEQVLICQHFNELLDKPLVVALPSIITSAELSYLWKAGVDGIVVPHAQSIESLVKLREMIDNLPKEARRGQGKVLDVTLPHYERDISVEEEEEI